MNVLTDTNVYLFMELGSELLLSERAKHKVISASQANHEGLKLKFS